MDKPYIIGICGGSGSGKTFFLSKLKEDFAKNDLCILTYDNYYRPLHMQELDSNGIANFDLPTAIDSDQFLKDLQLLINGCSVFKKEYTFNNPAVDAKVIEIKPAPIIILEGLFIFCIVEIFNKIDLKIFIDAPDEIKLERRLQRDKLERGYGIDDVMYRTCNHVAQSFIDFIEPYKNLSDIIIPNHKNFDNALNLLNAFVKMKLMRGEIN